MAAVAAVLFLFSAQYIHPQAASPNAASPSPNTSPASILQANESELSLSAPQGAGGRAVKGSGINAWSFVQMFLILGLVAAAIYGVSILIKKYNKNAGSNSPGLRVLASAGLGPGKAVHVVQAGKQAFLVGAADQAVSLLSELTDKEYVDQLVLDAETKPQKAKADFSSLLTGILDPQGKKRGAGAIHSNALDLMGKQRDRLKKL
jgi:flagellar biosynthetic protein FliO